MEVEHIISRMPEVYPARKFECYVKVGGELQKFDSFDAAHTAAEDIEWVEVDTDKVDKKLDEYESHITEFDACFDSKYSHLPKWVRESLYETSLHEVEREFEERSNPQMFYRVLWVRIEAKYAELVGSLCS